MDGGGGDKCHEMQFSLLLQLDAIHLDMLRERKTVQKLMQ